MFRVLFGEGACLRPASICFETFVVGVPYGAPTPGVCADSVCV